MASYGQTSASMRSRSTAAATNGSQNAAATLEATSSSDDPYTNSSSSVDVTSVEGSSSTTSSVASAYPRTSSLARPGAVSSLGLGVGKNKGRLPASGASGIGGAKANDPLTKAEQGMLVGVTVLALFVRLWKLGQPSSVVFDEVHFGGFASKYIKQKFFMDVHPPLAKLLITLVAWAAGFNGNFDFKDIGREYLVGPDTPVPYVAMRGLCALLGVGTVPLSFLILRGLSLRASTALIGAIFVTFENALTTQSRLILLDSPLIFFTALTTYCWVSFCNEERRAPFTSHWWGWLALTGASLGAVASCKWVGFFTIATVGLCVIAQLWYHLGDVRQPVSVLVRHFVARAICLIALPFIFYLSTFAIHLGVLQRSGDGDGFMSSSFQHTLVGHGMRDTYADVALGSTVTIRHLNTQGGYLHSHLHSYPGGSGQQQVTLYPHRDENNEWYIIGAPGPNDPPPPLDDEGVPLAVDGPHDVERYMNSPLEFLKDGMEIRLMHRKTEKRLHSHDSNRPPITESDYQNEVTGYGFPGFTGDANDNFIVQIEAGDASDRESSKRVRALRTHFRLRHSLTGCYLFSHKVTLPDWGFGQQEVTCNKNPTKPNSLWYVETNTHPLIGGALPPPIPEGDDLAKDAPLPPIVPMQNPPMVNYLRPSFWAKFWELQRVMWETNAGLTDRHAYDSRPPTWPMLRRGINFWTKDHRQVYLIGNPFVWWGATVAVFVYLGARAILMLRAKRGYRDFNDTFVVFYDSTCGFLFLGWAMHYLPFFAMSRQLFIHHYLPALYFGILLLAAVFDMVTSMLKPKVRLQVAALLAVVAILGFQTYAPLTYAGKWSARACERSRMLKTWDFNCRDFPADLSAYQSFGPGIHTAHHPVLLNATAGAGTSAVEGVIDAAQAQAGNHVFENQPKVAWPSDGAVASVIGDDASLAEAQASQAGKDEGKAEQAGAQPIAPAEPAPKEAAADEAQLKPQGLDNEAMQEVVLEGTADAGRAQVEAPMQKPGEPTNGA